MLVSLFIFDARADNLANISNNADDDDDVLASIREEVDDGDSSGHRRVDNVHERSQAASRSDISTMKESFSSDSSELAVDEAVTAEIELESVTTASEHIALPAKVTARPGKRKPHRTHKRTESLINDTSDVLNGHYLTRAFSTWKNTNILEHSSGAKGCARGLVLLFTYAWLLIMMLQVASGTILVNAEAVEHVGYWCKRAMATGAADSKGFIRCGSNRSCVDYDTGALA